MGKVKQMACICLCLIVVYMSSSFCSKHYIYADAQNNILGNNMRYDKLVLDYHVNDIVVAERKGGGYSVLRILGHIKYGEAILANGSFTEMGKPLNGDSGLIIPRSNVPPGKAVIDGRFDNNINIEMILYSEVYASKDNAIAFAKKLMKKYGKDKYRDLNKIDYDSLLLQAVARMGICEMADED